MKKVFALIISLAMMLVLVLAAPASAVEVATADLIIDGGVDGTQTDIGDVSVDLTGSDVTVTATIADPLSYEILESHVYVANTAPAKHTPGKFPNELGDAVTVTATEGSVIYIAVHLEIGLLEDGEPMIDPITEEQMTESAWAQEGTTDVLFRTGKVTKKGSSWASYFSYTVPVA
jgi:hypothetical protein